MRAYLQALRVIWLGIWLSLREHEHWARRHANLLIAQPDFGGQVSAMRWRSGSLCVSLSVHLGCRCEERVCCHGTVGAAAILLFEERLLELLGLRCVELCLISGW